MTFPPAVPYLIRGDSSRVRPEFVLTFSLDRLRFGVRLEDIERVVHAVAVTRLPGAPAVVRGIFNLRGRIIPVLSLRHRFGLGERALELSDQFIVARVAERTMALVVDETTGVTKVAASDISSATTILPKLPYLEGVVQLKDDLVLIHDLATCLALDEAAALDEALSAKGPTLSR